MTVIEIVFVILGILGSLRLIISDIYKSLFKTKNEKDIDQRLTEQFSQQFDLEVKKSIYEDTLKIMADITTHVNALTHVRFINGVPRSPIIWDISKYNMWVDNLVILSSKSRFKLREFDVQLQKLHAYIRIFDRYMVPIKLYSNTSYNSNRDIILDIIWQDFRKMCILIGHSWHNILLTHVTEWNKVVPTTEEIIHSYLVIDKEFDKSELVNGMLEKNIPKVDNIAFDVMTQEWIY